MSEEIRYQRALTILHRTIGVDVLVTAVGDQSVHRLSGPAGTAWVMLESPMSIASLASKLASFYGVEARTVWPQVRDLVDDLARREWLVASREQG